MKSPSLVFRLVVLQLGLAATIMVIFAGSAAWLSARTVEREEKSFLSDAVSLAAHSLEHEWREEGDLGRAAAAALEENAPPGVRIDILDPQGRLVGSTARDRGRSTEMREVRVRLARGATVVASMPTRPEQRAISALLTAFGISAIPLFVLVLILSRTLAGRALRPLSRMALQAERHPLHGAVRPLGRATDPVEVSALASAFNRLIARLEEGVRVEQHFTQDAAHELRTPITVLSGELEYARLDASLSERQRYSLARASDQVRQMSELVDALLLLRRAGSGAPSELEALPPVNLGDLVGEVSGELLARLPARAADVRLEADDEVLVAGHATLIQSAIRNLLANALKFTREGEPVRVTVRPRDDQGVVVVEDGGPGVAPENLERIFDPFFRSAEARAAQDGFGLGLPILRRVARVHGGDVVVSTSSIGGARFDLSLPLWKPREAAGETR